MYQNKIILKKNIFTIESDYEIKKGKNILFIAGIHGNELSSICLANQLYKEYEYQNITKNLLFNNLIKKITIVPCVNLEGLRSRKREVTADVFDLNRGWSKNVDENEYTTIEDLLKSHDIIVDLHSSPNCTNMFYLDVKQRGFEDYVRFCKSTKCKFGVSDSYNDSIKIHACNDLNKIAFTWEMTGMDTINYTAVYDSFEYFKNTFIPNICSNNYSFNNYYDMNKSDDVIAKTIVADSEGLYRPLYNLLISKVAKNDAIYSLKNINPDNLDRHINSNMDGFIIDATTNSYVKPGEFLYQIQPLIEDIK